MEGSAPPSMQTIGIGLAIALPLSYLWFLLWVRVIAVKFDLGFELYQGSPRWLYYSSCTLMTPMILMGFYCFAANGEESMDAWFARPWLQPYAQNQWLEFVWILWFIMYNFKDFPAGVGFMIVLHHACCVGSSIAILLMGPPGLYVGGVTIMELGSFSHNFMHLYPSKATRMIDLFVMTFANAFGVYCAFNIGTQPGLPGWYKYPCAFVLLVLIEERQREIICYNLCGKSSQDDGQSSEVEAPQEKDTQLTTTLS